MKRLRSVVLAKEAANPESKPKPKPESKPKPKPKPAPRTKSKLAARPTNTVRPAHGATVTVSNVIDGDTIEVSPAIDGVQDVRLIGVNTPETVDPAEGVGPYGPQASDFATRAQAQRQLLPGDPYGLDSDGDGVACEDLP